MKRIGVAFGLSAMLLVSPGWSASKRDAIAAEALFREGTKLAKAERCDEAVPKLLESHRLDPATGTLLNLVRCERKLGKLASAWQHAQDAVALAREERKQDKEKAAQALATELEAVVPRIRIELPTKVPDGLELVRDDTTLSVAAAGSEIPADPGAHVVRATAPAHRAQERRFDVREGEGIIVIKLGAFERLPTSAEPKAPLVVVGPTVPGAEKPEPKTKGNRTAWLGGLIGAGAAGATGLVTGALVISGVSTLKSQCEGKVCTPEQQSKLSGLKTLSTVSTVAFIATGVGAAVAIVFWPSKSPVEARVGVGSLELGGTF